MGRTGRRGLGDERDESLTDSDGVAEMAWAGDDVGWDGMGWAGMAWVGDGVGWDGDGVGWEMRKMRA